MQTAELDERGRIVLDIPFRLHSLAKEVPGTTFRNGVWSLPVSWANCLALRGVFGDQLEFGPHLTAWGFAERDSRVQPALEARARALDPSLDAAGDPRLYPYQRTGVEFLRAAGSAILADEMGTGKTVQTIMALEAEDAYPTLVVAPNSVKGTWLDEFARWAPHRKVQVIHGGVATRRKQLAVEADVYVINWDALRLHSRLAGYGSIALTDKDKQPGELNRPWAAVVADEAHRAKEPKAKQTRALWAIGATAERRYALTGTPLANTPGDFWAILRFVSPDEWPAKTKYIDRYCLMSWNSFGGMDVIGLRSDTRDEFFRVVDPRFLRRQKALVLPQLPPKVRQVVRVSLAKKQREAYDAMKRGMAAELDGGQELVAFDALAKLGRLTQLAASYATVEPDGQVRLSEPSAKLDALEDLIDEIAPEPVVVFAASRQLIELAAARLVKRDIRHGLITGAVDAATREAVKHNFQEGKLQVILLTLGAGAEGLTLTRASSLIFLQRSWSLTQNLQAEDRIHRPGAEVHDSVHIIDIIADDTVEDGVLDAIETKGDMLDQITRDRAMLRRMLG